MSKENSAEETESGRKELAIEGQLPLKAVGIENLKEANPQHMPPHRYLHPWFARRPTPVSRLAILASIMPKETTSNELLQLMQIGPKQDLNGEIARYVESRKATEGDRSGTLGDHYGYPRPFTQSPSIPQRDDLHSKLKQFWNGELPTVLDPTAGGGVIPFESLRYDLPTVANELNAVPTMMLKTILEYAPKFPDLDEEVTSWAKLIDERATEKLHDYFPSQESNQIVSHYASTYTVECDECGFDIPLLKKWWLLKKNSSKGVAIRPSLDHENAGVSYECVSLPDEISKDEFNPQNGPFGRSGAECLNCGVVTEMDTIKEKLRNDEFTYEVFGVKYEKRTGGSGFRAPTKRDQEAQEQAIQRIENEFELNSLLDIDRYIGDIHDRSAIYGVTKWKDGFTPRQLVTHYEYLKSFEHYKKQIKSEHGEEKCNGILTLLSLIASKVVDRNSRFSPLDTSKGYPGDALGGKNYGLQWAFVENNPSAGNQSYENMMERVLDSYSEISNYLRHSKPNKSRLLNGDAADLCLDSESVQAVVIDPPYYDSIIYSEMSDMPYVWLREYLQDAFPDIFADELSDKDSEAVANVAEYEDLANSNKSKQEFADEDYESKMESIFNELYRVLEPGGVMTVMFTHKESAAWDTLTMSLINSGFTITSTHPISSEMPQRTDTRGGGSADSTLLLTGRKPTQQNNASEIVPTLWGDVRSETRQVAKEAARDLIDSGASLTKTDIIISAFGPTLQVYADAYPVVDDQDQEVAPRRALEEAREAVTRVLVEEFLEGERLDNLDDITEWYILSWLVHESDTFNYDDGRQLGLGIGVDIDEIKRSTKIWGKKRGDIQLKSYSDRVQNVTLPPDERSNRTPVDPDALSFTIALDAVHAAMHIYKKQGEDVAIDWLKERNFDTDAAFKATLEALLQVLPQDNSEWEAARDLALGRTHDALNLDFTPTDFANLEKEMHEQTDLTDHT